MKSLMHNGIAPLDRLHQSMLVAKRLDWAAGACMVFALVSPMIFCFVTYLWDRPEPLWAKVLGATVSGGIVGAPGVLLVGFAARQVFKAFSRTWVIDDSQPNVVKLIGAVPFAQFDIAEKTLLRTRPGYMICDHAYEQFRCTMAAVPVEAMCRGRSTSDGHGAMPQAGETN